TVSPPSSTEWDGSTHLGQLLGECAVSATTDTQTVTEHGSASGDRAVTCNACERFDWWDRHCTTCHDDDHRACAHCGACLPDRHRRDRYYCNDACRAQGHKARRRAELEHEVWAAEHPEEAQREADDLRKRDAEVRSLDALLTQNSDGWRRAR